MKYRLQHHESEIHATSNILLKSFRRKKAEKTTGKDLMIKTMSPIQTAWYVNSDISENVDKKPAKEDVSSFETTSPVTPTSNVLLKSFRRKKTDILNNNDLKSSSAVKTLWYVDADGGGDGKVDVGGEGGEGGEGEGGERWVPCVLLGDGMVGKTSLTVSYTQHRFNDRYTATVFDNYPVPVQINGEKYVVDLCDTAGQSDYESLRTSTYESSEVLVLCFSVCDRESFSNVLHSWVPEIQRHAKGRRPLLLVGTQTDLRASSSSSSSHLKSSSSAHKSSSSDHAASNSSPSDTKAPNSSLSDLKNANSSPKDLEASKSSASNFTTSNFSSSVSKSSPSELKASNSSTSNSKTAKSSSHYMKAFDSSTSNSKTSKSSSSQGVKASDSSDRRMSYSSSSSSSSCQNEVSTEEGRQLARIIGADCYIECSARSEEGVQQVFEYIVSSALRHRKKKSSLLSRLFSR